MGFCRFHASDFYRGFIDIYWVYWIYIYVWGLCGGLEGLLVEVWGMLASVCRKLPSITPKYTDS